METNSKKKSNRGGRREGAGRKKTTAKYYYFSALPKVHEILEQVTGSKSEFMNKCILAAHSLVE